MCTGSGRRAKLLGHSRRFERLIYLRKRRRFNERHIILALAFEVGVRQMEHDVIDR
jgi:hypothetical protein